MGLFSRIAEVIDKFFYEEEPPAKAYEERKWKRQKRELEKAVEGTRRVVAAKTHPKRTPAQKKSHAKQMRKWRAKHPGGGTS